MVQEFHVLRCYSCQTYQVQQVKKSKKWNCKMCGEKQSVLKEFGRGSGVDCRRHVQKLNARRGEMLEQDQKAWSQWKEVGNLAAEQLAEGVEGGGSHNSEEAQGSRWTKYLQTTDEDSAVEEEENVYMDRNRLHGDRNLRKLKRGREENESQQSHLNGEEDPVPPTSWTLRGKTAKTQHNGHPSLLAPADWAPKQSGVCRRPVPAYSEPHNVSAPPSTTGRNTFSTPTVVSNRVITSQPYGSCGTEVSHNSKWAQFLTPAEERGRATTTPEDDFRTIGSVVSDVPEDLHEVLVDQSCTKPPTKTSGCVSLLAGGSDFLGKTFDRLKSTVTRCGFGETDNSGGAGHALLSKEKEVLVCPPPTTRPCSALFLGTLFCTDDDFDDTF